MDTLTAILRAPVNTILIIAGLVILFFTLFKVSKKTVQLTAGKPHAVPLIVGALLIVVGLFYRTGYTAPETPTVEISVASATLPPPAASETSSPTDTPVPTISPTNTDTPQPTLTPQIKKLADGCIAAQTWQPKSINTESLSSISEQDHCLNLAALGISVDQGGKLHLLATASNAELASGISMPVSDQSVIEFKVFVKSFSIHYPDKPADITFSIAPQDDPMAGGGSGRFKLRVEQNINLADVFFFLAGTNELTGSKDTSQHYKYEQTSTVRMELKNINMQIYVNDAKLSKKVTIPSGSIVFYIGYDLPALAGMDVEITDIKVDGKTP